MPKFGTQVTCIQAGRRLDLHVCRYHGNKGRPRNILHDSAESAMLKNPLVGPNISGLYAIQADLYAILYKVTQISLPWQQGSAHNILHGSIESVIPENPLVGPNIFGLSAIKADL